LLNFNKLQVKLIDFDGIGVKVQPLFYFFYFHNHKVVL